MEQEKKNIYRVRVEWIGDHEPDEDESLGQEYLDGLECDGFTFLMHCQDEDCDGHTCIQHMRVMDIAQILANSPDDTVMQAAHIAKAMAEAKEMRSKGRMESKLAKIFGN